MANQLGLCRIKIGGAIGHQEGRLAGSVVTGGVGLHFVILNNGRDGGWNYSGEGRSFGCIQSGHN